MEGTAMQRSIEPFAEAMFRKSRITALANGLIQFEVDVFMEDDLLGRKKPTTQRWLLLPSQAKRLAEQLATCAANAMQLEKEAQDRPI
jgi:hypothetical protein